MARTCDICGRGALNANSRSHSNIPTKRRQHLNLQQTAYKGKRVKACARCIKSMTKKGTK
ncbi:MAG: 50S ribosomal protein L28 [Patescibacteria group bacterium]|nr:50S ribosomal protein L28 [Patescibacteria group bacterium]MDD5715382.1 50S ribosomal protein L28 [Patescibacteria group bacterium]